jgi:hypothetical protein
MTTMSIQICQVWFLTIWLECLHSSSAFMISYLAFKYTALIYKGTYAEYLKKRKEKKP